MRYGREAVEAIRDDHGSIDICGDGALAPGSDTMRGVQGAVYSLMESVWGAINFNRVYLAVLSILAVRACIFSQPCAGRN